MSKVEEGHFQREGNVLKLSEASYETFLRYQMTTKTFCPIEKLTVVRRTVSKILKMAALQTWYLAECLYALHL